MSELVPPSRGLAFTPTAGVVRQPLFIRRQDYDECVAAAGQAFVDETLTAVAKQYGFPGWVIDDFIPKGITR